MFFWGWWMYVECKSIMMSRREAAVLCSTLAIRAIVSAVWRWRSRTGLKMAFLQGASGMWRRKENETSCCVISLSRSWQPKGVMVLLFNEHNPWTDSLPEGGQPVRNGWMSSLSEGGGMCVVLHKEGLIGIWLLPEREGRSGLLRCGGCE